MGAPEVARAQMAAREIFGLPYAVGPDHEARRRRQHGHPGQPPARGAAAGRAGDPVAAAQPHPTDGRRRDHRVLPARRARAHAPGPRPGHRGPAAGDRTHRRRVPRRRRPGRARPGGRNVARPRRGAGHRDGRPLHRAPGRSGGRGLLRPRRVPQTRLAAGSDPRPAARRPLAGPRPSRSPRRPTRRPLGPHRRGACSPARPARAARTTSTAGSRRSMPPRSAACACSTTSSQADVSTSQPCRSRSARSGPSHKRAPRKSRRQAPSMTKALTFHRVHVRRHGGGNNAVLRAAAAAHPSAAFVDWDALVDAQPGCARPRRRPSGPREPRPAGQRRRRRGPQAVM